MQMHLGVKRTPANHYYLSRRNRKQKRCFPVVQLAVVRPSELTNPLAGWKMTIVLCWLSVFFVAVMGLELRTSHHGPSTQTLSSFYFFATRSVFPKLCLNLWSSCHGFWSSWDGRPVPPAWLHSITVKKRFFFSFLSNSYYIWNNQH